MIYNKKKPKIRDIGYVRNGKFSFISYAIAAIALTFCFIEYFFIIYNIIKSTKEYQDRYNIIIFMLFIIMIHSLFINNIRLKASILLFGNIDEDRKFLSIIEKILENIFRKRKYKVKNIKQ